EARTSLFLYSALFW
ncbi:bacterial regulatory s, gntR family protein, partial [Vibrio parahaemolyticus EKP-028]